MAVVLEESSINVCVRVRPFSEKESTQLAPSEDVTPFLGDGGLGGSPSKHVPGSLLNTHRTRFIRPIIKSMDKQVLVFDPPDTNPLTRLYSNSHFAHGNKRNKDIRYAFDRVFDATASQRDVFEETCKPLLDGVLNGYNASVFAYGATGCGKTHTISGTPEHPGLIFLTLKELYDRIQDARDESQVQIRLSYLEIYNETIRDLLSVEPTPPGAGLALREDANNKMSVVGITEIIPESPESVLQYIQEGNLRRTMSPTEANAVSSRSHAVLQINVTQKPRTASLTEQTTSASLNIIDLAGSERASATRNNGARMKEGANINKSLLALGNCINALCQSGGARKHVPYRNSKLTRLLKFSLGGNCKTVMVVCISPSSTHYDETHNALKYANQAKNIRTKVTRNTINIDRHVAQYVQAIHELKEENERLKSRLDERGSLQTAAEKRKRAEMGKELDEAKKRMRESTDNVSRAVAEKSPFEAQTAAAEARVSGLRSRIAKLEGELAGHSSRGETLPSDLEGERDVLQALLHKEEAALNNDETRAGVRSLLNSLQMQRALVVAVSHNQNFDSEATETIKTMGSAMLSELEACQSKTKVETLLDILRNTTVDLTSLITVAARSTVALREVAGELEYRANSKSSESGEDLASTLSLLASQLRCISTENDKVFEEMSGTSLPKTSKTSTSADRAPKARLMSSSTSALRRNNNTSASASSSGSGLSRSTSSAVLGRAGPAARRASLAPSAPRSASIQVSSLSPIRAGVASGLPRLSPSSSQPTLRLPSFAAPTSASSAKSHVVSSPSRKLPSRRVSTAGRRLSSIRPPRPSVSLSYPMPVEEKKKFRWADEAGEGTIDDKGLRDNGAGHAELLAPPIAIHKSASRVTTLASEQDEGSTGNSSGTEWEDLSDGRTPPAKSHPATTVSQAASSTGNPFKRAVSFEVKSADSIAKSTSFDRTSHLAKKRSVSTGSTLTALSEDGGEEGDISTSSSPIAPLGSVASRPLASSSVSTTGGAARQPFRALNLPSVQTTAGPASASAKLLLNGVSFQPSMTPSVLPIGFDASVPRKPFPRPSAGGPGPMRRKVGARASVAIATPLSLDGLGAASGAAGSNVTIPGQTAGSGIGNRVKASRVSMAGPTAAAGGFARLL